MRTLLGRLGFKLWHAMLGEHDPNGRPLVLAGLDEFREHLGGELTVTLLTGIGSAIEVHEIDSQIVEDAIRALEWEHRGP
jgi:3-dehydroquinate synthase